MVSISSVTPLDFLAAFTPLRCICHDMYTFYDPQTFVMPHFYFSFSAPWSAIFLALVSTLLDRPHFTEKFYGLWPSPLPRCMFLRYTVVVVDTVDDCSFTHGRYFEVHFRFLRRERV